MPLLLIVTERGIVIDMFWKRFEEDAPRIEGKRVASTNISCSTQGSTVDRQRTFS